LTGKLYLLHIEPSYEHAKHYLGFTTGDIDARVLQHLNGQGSPLIRAAIEAGREVRVARCWPVGTRGLERRLKRQGGLSRHCPTCRLTGVYHR
jgi:predicted GIY-YIG superfamily endonuclease